MTELPDGAVKRLVEAASKIDLLPVVLAQMPAAVERVNALRRSWIANGNLREDSQANDDLGVVTLAATWAENGLIAARVRAETLRAGGSDEALIAAALDTVSWELIGKPGDPTARSGPREAAAHVARAVADAVRAEAVADERRRIIELVGDMCTYRERDGRALPHPHPADHLGPCPYGQAVQRILAAGSVPVATAGRRAAKRQQGRTVEEIRSDIAIMRRRGSASFHMQEAAGARLLRDIERLVGPS